MKPQLIPDRLKSARENLKLNKSQAAELLGLSPIGYLRYEQGLRSPSPQMLKTIALSMETSVSYLTGETEDPSPDAIVISRNDNPELFELALALSESKFNKARRMITYYQKIIDSVRN